MKKLMLLLSLLPAFLIPGRAQQVPEFATGTEYLEYVGTLQLRRSKVEQMRTEDAARRSQRYEQLTKEAAAESDAAKRRVLEDEAAVAYRMIGEVASRFLDETYNIDRELDELQERYQFVFEEAFPYYREREKYSKEELQDALKKASRTIRRSETGKALKQYIKTLP